MSEPEKPAAPAAAPSAKTSKLVLVLLVLNLGASGFGVFHMLTSEPAAAAASGHGEHQEEDSGGSTSEIKGPILALDPFVVNLDEPGNARYLRVNIQLELVSAEVQPAIQKSLLLVRDVILSHLSGLHLSDTLGAQAKEKLRGEIVTKLEAAVGQHKIRRAFFQEFVVQ